MDLQWQWEDILHLLEILKSVYKGWDFMIKAFYLGIRFKGLIQIMTVYFKKELGDDKIFVDIKMKRHRWKQGAKWMSKDRAMRREAERHTKSDERGKENERRGEGACNLE